jgi:hypothetical protein
MPPAILDMIPEGRAMEGTRISFAMAENLTPDLKRPRRLAPVWRALIEVGFIVFLYYSNLLMGEFESSGQGRSRGLWWAVHDIFTESNFTIALVTALIGYLVFEFLRKRF